MCAVSANAQTNGYALSVNGGSTTNLTFDLNGNMTSDGTNAYTWDAENRMIKVTYPGTNNFSTFVYDGYGKNVSIVETTAGSVTSTKQFVWSKDRQRAYQPCEERDSAGVLTKKFFDRGQMNTTTKYFYDLDHLNSIREMTDNAGAIVAEYSFAPFGQITKISETIPSDFGYAGYYSHLRSGLNLTRKRPYSPILGRWLSRDPVEEVAGLNLYAYVNNGPTNSSDPFGTQTTIPTPTPTPTPTIPNPDAGTVIVVVIGTIIIIIIINLPKPKPPKPDPPTHPGPYRNCKTQACCDEMGDKCRAKKNADEDCCWDVQDACYRAVAKGESYPAWGWPNCCKK